jgi:hypothetical protein
VEQPVGFIAQGLGHAASLAIGPDHATMRQVDPAPFESHDFETPTGELECRQIARKMT